MLSDHEVIEKAKFLDTPTADRLIVKWSEMSNKIIFLAKKKVLEKTKRKSTSTGLS